MKHLKKFEGLSDPYYVEIPYKQYSHDTKKDSDFLTTREIDFLTGKIKSDLETKPLNSYFIIDNPKTDQGDFNQILIGKMDDGWYLVRVEFNRTHQIYGYYKCDQWEGLVGFLKDKKVLNETFKKI